MTTSIADHDPPQPAPALGVVAPHDPARHEARVGLYYGLAAYLWWGGVALYFRAVAHVAPLEVLAHRIVWSVAMLGVLLALRRRLGEALSALRSPR
jgi:chloramphenicol-sensitive protein RarD